MPARGVETAPSTRTLFCEHPRDNFPVKCEIGGDGVEKPIYLLSFVQDGNALFVSYGSESSGGSMSKTICSLKAGIKLENERLSATDYHELGSATIILPLTYHN